MDLTSIRNICLELPAATESVKWEDHLVFSVGDKMFLMTSFSPPFHCSLKVSADEFDDIVARPGFRPAPYLARAKWVLVADDAPLSAKQWNEIIRRSYELVKAKLSKKLRSELGL